MAETINWMYSVRADLGPTVTSSGTDSVDGYEKINVALDPGDTQDITIGPGTWTEILTLIVTADDLTGAVTVQPDGAPSAVALNGPIVLLGSGAVSLLGSGDALLTVENTGANAVSVDIFVARDATP